MGQIRGQGSYGINLVAGQRYYIEARHMNFNSANANHLEVGWEHESGFQERPIPGKGFLNLIYFLQPIWRILKINIYLSQSNQQRPNAIF
jgi:hypothetical protein